MMHKIKLDLANLLQPIASGWNGYAFNPVIAIPRIKYFDARL
jgi:hypothetical protein